MSDVYMEYRVSMYRQQGPPLLTDISWDQGEEDMEK